MGGQELMVQVGKAGAGVEWWREGEWWEREGWRAGREKRKE